MRKRLDAIFAAPVLVLAVAAVLAGGRVPSGSITREADMPPLGVAQAHISMPEEIPEATPKPAQDAPAEQEASTYHSEIPLPEELQKALYEACAEYDVPVALALGVIEAESCFDPDAVSSEGCLGLMQINPVYAWKLEESTGCSYLTPEGNVCCGVWYLSSLIEKYDGSIEKALVSYNQGSYRGVITEYARNVLSAAERWGAME